MPAILGPTGLAGYGTTAATEAIQAQGAESQLEATRQLENQRIEQANKAGFAKIGSAVGTAAGSAFGGPIGGMIGGTAGGLIGGLF